MSAFEDITSYFNNAKIHVMLDKAGTAEFSIGDPKGKLRVHFKAGDYIRFKFGFDTLYSDYVFNGFLPPRSVRVGNVTINLMASDFIGNLTTFGEYARLTGSGFNYNGWECTAVMEQLVNSINDTPLTFSGGGTSPVRFIENKDKLYSDDYTTKQEIIKRILDIAVDDDVHTQNFPLKYHYFQLNHGSTCRFKVFKEVDSPTSIKTFTSGDDLLVGSTINQEEQYNVGRVSETDLIYEYDDAIAHYGRIEKIFDKKYENDSQNLDYIRREVHNHFLEQYSFSATVLDSYSIPNLGDYITIDNAENDLQNGTHLVTEIRFNISPTTVSCNLILSNKRTRL